MDVVHFSTVLHAFHIEPVTSLLGTFLLGTAEIPDFMYLGCFEQIHRGP